MRRAAACRPRARRVVPLASRARASSVRTDQPSSAALRASRRRAAWSSASSSARPWPSRQVAGLEQRERLVGQVEQAQEVRDGDAAAADAQADVLAGEPELLDEGRAGARLLDRVEVLAGHVLDEGELERRRVVALAHERGDALQPGEPRGAPAALAGDELVRPAGERADEDGLEDAVRRDRVGERLERRLVEARGAAGSGSAR